MDIRNDVFYYSVQNYYVDFEIIEYKNNKIINKYFGNYFKKNSLENIINYVKTDILENVNFDLDYRNYYVFSYHVYLKENGVKKKKKATKFKIVKTKVASKYKNIDVPYVKKNIVFNDSFRLY